ncbi:MULTISPECIES: hypothetical protein [Flavobacterium]|uniref:DUF4105 domain-containing protein n=1 Tax=Flavobacterium lipolyticum TaxID=2893754 RepID=A0ABS8M1K1_9FLAO|nr:MULTISPECIES: hypothetical protein [unclassified Flavobacterium]MCC9018719.1 hypothetical protein [Flavobacterium sp. F-126]
MMHKLKNVTSVFIFISMTLLFSRCQTEEIESNNESLITANAKKWFEKSETSLDVLKYTKLIDWNNAVVINEEGRKAVEVPLVLLNNTSTNVVEDKDYKSYMRLLFIEDEEGIFKVFDIDYTTKDIDFDNNSKEFNLYKTGTKYSGYITVQSAKNKVVYSGKFEKGEQVSLHNLDQGKNTTNRTVCTYYVTVGPYTKCSNWMWVPDYGPGSLPPGYMPGISGPMYVTWSDDILLNAPQEAKKIANRQDYFKNFNLNSEGTLHVYVDQPIANKSDAYDGMVNPEVGHTFLAIEQNGIVRVIGYYPSNGVNPFTSPGSSPAYLNDSGHSYDVRISKTLTASQLSEVISKITNYSGQYNLNTNNCSDFAQQIAATGGLKLPNTDGSWPGGGGTNPGNLGQDIRNMALPSGASIKTTGGIALSNSK